MRKMKKILLSIIVFTLYSHFVMSQTSSHSPMSNMILCETQPGAITISGNFVSTDQVYIVIPSNDTVTYNNFTVTSGTISQLGDTLIIENLPSTNSVILNYTTELNCDAHNINSYSLSNSYDFSLNQNVWTSHSSNTYLIQSPVLNFIGGDQLNYNNAQLGVGTTRSFYYTNSNNTASFNGVVEFRDTIPHLLSNSAVTFDSIFLASNNGSVLNYEITDSTVLLTVQVDNLAQGDTLKISDIIQLNTCVVLQNNVTKYELAYGCSTTDLCQTVSENLVNFTTSVNFDPNDKPGITVLDIDLHHESCYYDTITRIERFVNTGLGAASSFQTILRDNNNISGLTFLNPSSIKIYLNTISPTTEMLTTIAPPDIHNQNIVVTNDGVLPGDTVILVYTESNKCIATSEYDTYFNNAISIHDISGKAHFNHPCNPTGYPAHGTHIASLHLYQLNQQFNNLIGTVADNEINWFEIDNQSDVLFGGDSYALNGDEIGSDLNHSQIEVELLLESGLSLTNLDSLMFCSSFGGATSTLPLIQSELIYGLAGPDQFDTIRAIFQIPSSFQTPINGHNPFKKTSEFYQFFANSKIKFQTKASCDDVGSDSKAIIRENVYFVIDTNCRGCKLPLASVETEINILCPGCVLPGWNLTKMDVERINLGYADSDNNHFPDTYPLQAANPNDVNNKHVIIGDTLELSVEGFISNGDPSTGFTFTTLGIVFDEGQFLFKGDVDKLKFIGGHGTFIQGNISTSFYIPAGVEDVFTGAIGIDMSISSLNSYGITSISNYHDSCSVIFKPQFKVIDNYDDGLGANPYFDIKNITAFYLMGGTPFGAPDILIDANNSIDDIGGMSISERENLSYWCVGYDSRYVGIGVDFNLTYPSFSKNSFNGAEIPGGCQYRIAENIFGLVGDKIVQGGPGTNSPFTNGNATSSTSVTSFDNELRELFNLDSIQIEIPNGLELAEIRFNSSSYYVDTTSYLSKWAPFNTLTASGSDPLFSVNGTTLTVYPEEFIHQNTNLNNGDNHLTYDENNYLIPEIFLRHKSCPNGGSIPINSLEIKNYFSNFPGAQNGDTLISVTMTNNHTSVGVGTLGNIDLPDPQFIVDANQTLPIAGYNIGQAIDFSVFAQLPYTNANFLTSHTIGTAYNSFMLFESPNGNFTNITVPNVDNISTNFNTLASNTTSGSPAYTGTISGNLLVGTGTLGGQLNGSQSRQLDMFANYDCSNVAPGGTDSLYLIYGWNCFDYPETLENACFVDTFVLYVTVPNTGLAVEYGIQDPVSLCDTIHFFSEFDPTGFGEVTNVTVEITHENGQVVDYLPGTGALTQNSATTFIDPAITNTSYTWDLSASLQNFNELSPPALFNADLITGCGFTDDTLFVKMSGTNYCGQLIFEDTFEISPQVYSNLPLLDSLNLAGSAEMFTHCNDTSTVSINVSNMGGSSSSIYNEIMVTIPTGYQYVSGGSPIYSSNDTLILPISTSINSGNNSIINFEMVKTSTDCANELLSAQLILKSSYSCNGENCFYSKANTTLLEIPLILNSDVLNIIDIDPAAMCAGTNELTISFISSESGMLEVYNANNNQLLGQLNYLNTTGNTIQNTVLLTDSSSNLFFVNVSSCCPDTIYYAYNCDTICQVNADFTVGNYCLGDTIFVESTSAVSGTHEWIYNGGMMETGANANFITTQAGQHSIQHIFTADCGQIDTVIKDLTVYQPTTSSIVLNGVNPICPGDSIQLSVQNELNFSNFLWTTGETTPSIWVSNPGSYGVTLVDFNGCSIDLQSITVLTASNSVSGGSCTKCDASMTVTFDITNPACATITSCKDLSNVVLMDCYGHKHKFDGLSGNTDYFCMPDGHPITTVWVKSGCYKSGDGPGYGRRFDHPCNPCNHLPSNKSSRQGEVEKRITNNIKLDAYPNPFVESTIIEFTPDADSKVSLIIYDVYGKIVLTVFEGEAKSGNTYKSEFKPKSTSSLYFVRLLDENGVQLIQKLIQIK